MESIHLNIQNTETGLYILHSDGAIPRRHFLDFGQGLRKDLGSFKQEESNPLKDMILCFADTQVEIYNSETLLNILSPT